MKRRTVLQIPAALLTAPLARAQSGKTYRIGVLQTTSRAATPHLVRAFYEGMREFGYVEGKNLVVEWRGAEANFERLPVLAAELVALNLDVLVAGASPAALALKKATSTIPIVFVQSADPVRNGLVQTLARPGGNVTGLANLTDSIVGKQLELLRDVLPHLRQVAVMHNPADGVSALQLAAMRQAAWPELRIVVHETQGGPDLERVFGAMVREHPEALQVFFNTTTYGQLRRIVAFAGAQRLPAVYGSVDFVESGGLMSYAHSTVEHYRRGARYVDRILKGARPAELPVEQPTKLELAVNLKTAKAIGIAIPQTVVFRADRVIE